MGQIKKYGTGVKNLFTEGVSWENVDEQEKGVVRGLALGMGVAAASAALLSKAAVTEATTIPTAARGLRALGTNPRALGTNPRALLKGTQVLSAPATTRALNKKLFNFGLGLVGIGGVVQTRRIISAEAPGVDKDVEKYTNELKNIPEAVILGYQLDENGQIVEYSASDGLRDIRETREALNDANQKLKQVSIGNALLLVTSKYSKTRAEIEKQLGETTMAESKIIDTIVNPPTNLQNTKEIFRVIELNNLMEQ
jgi:hypothetical protein